MDITILDNPSASNLVLETLKRHLPYSVPTLRRLQFMNHSGGRATLNSHVLSTFDTCSPGNDFLIAFLDLSLGPNTEMWLYSSLENQITPGDPRICEAQLLALLARVRQINETYTSERVFPESILVGSLHMSVLEIFRKHGLATAEYSFDSEHYKFIFNVEDLPVGRELPVELHWSTVRWEDIPLVLSRTNIPYTTAMFKPLPSVAIATSTGRPVAWGFLGPDGSLKALHCEEEYRGQGFAKAVSLKLFRENAETLVKDRLFHADVATYNLQSQGVCKSLKGTIRWSCCWAEISVI
ncbi:hypothetical protein BJ878DRAFT_545515 [Calycina marina]|uniref:N-acetyltransferase domain-containing protein n=1 Tax=Calycina marina TaxID=1763456 RepID=A0A9P7YWA3_9HELO|nr:hypothetical protein BJ878DRAFT_545515 [Calycina marina]